MTKIAKTDLDRSTWPVLSRLGAGVEPEWATLTLASLQTGVPKGLLYGAIIDKRVKAVHVRREGARRGLLLVHMPSLKQYLEALVQEAP